MSGFLARLARQALGEPVPGAARLALPPRFAAGKAADVPLKADAAAWPMAGAGTSPLPANPPQRAVRSTPSNRQPAGTGRETRLRQPDLSTPAGDPDRRDPAPVEASRLRQDDPLPTTGRQAPQKTPSAASAALPPPSAPTSPVVPGRVAPARPAPIGQAALAVRIPVHRDARPVVTVTIDRIEVRAPRAPPAQAIPRRAPREPAEALADYLEARR
jgi:hypothetical protein